MKLCLRQRIFTWFDTYDVTSEDGVTFFTIRGELALFHHRLTVLDGNGIEVATLEERMLTFRKHFYIDIPNRASGELIKEWTLFQPRFFLDFVPWTVTGDFFGWDYSILNGPTEIARIYKQFFTWGDTYVIDVANPNDALLCLLIVVGIDITKEDHH